jgi:hypothetical protein
VQHVGPDVLEKKKKKKEKKKIKKKKEAHGKVQ